MSLVRTVALVAMVAIGLCGCARGSWRAPKDRTSMADIAAATGAKLFPHEAGSAFVVAVIPELHHLPRCQQRVLKMLADLQSRTSFVAVEGRIGEVRHDEMRGSLRIENDRLVMLAQLTAQPPGHRATLADAWAGDGEYPRDGVAGMPIEAALLYEALHQDRVYSRGIESNAVYRRASRAASTYQRAGGSAPWTAVVFARNRVFVEKLAHYGAYLRAPGRDVVAFPVGAFHVNDLTRRLRRAGITYALLVDDACLGAH